MMTLNELRDHMQKIGYISRAEAAAILGISDGGNLARTLDAGGVRKVILPSTGSGKQFVVYAEADVRSLAAYRSKKPVPAMLHTSRPVPGGTENGGRLSSRISQLSAYISQLEARVEQLEAFARQFE